MQISDSLSFFFIWMQISFKFPDRYEPATSQVLYFIERNSYGYLNSDSQIYTIFQCILTTGR